MKSDVILQGIPPLDTRIFFLAGEWGCSPHWFYGYVWQSSAPNQPLQFYIVHSEKEPPFHAPEYRGKYILATELMEKKEKPRNLKGEMEYARQQTNYYP